MRERGGEGRGEAGKYAAGFGFFFFARSLVRCALAFCLMPRKLFRSKSFAHFALSSIYILTQRALGEYSAMGTERGWGGGEGCFQK